MSFNLKKTCWWCAARKLSVQALGFMNEQKVLDKVKIFGVVGK